MLLKELLAGIYNEPVEKRFEHLDIADLSCDSRDIKPHTLFVALTGQRFNGHDFILEAVNRGATVIVLKNSDEGGPALDLPSEILVLGVTDPKKFLYDAAQRFYGMPSEKVKVFGITGTNGKTTITYLLESMAQQYQKKCAVVGTINYRVGDEILPSKNTTPSFLDNQKFLARLFSQKVDYSFMEVSSHALVQGRVDLIQFRVAIFTNLTGDHLDYHKTMDEYFRAKSLLFKGLSRDAVAVINADDAYGHKLLDLTEARVYTYGLNPLSRIKANNVQFDFTGSKMDIETPVGNFCLSTRLIGMHNVYNILAAVGAGLADGIPIENIRQGIEQVPVIPGRLEYVDCSKDYYVFIDYAHTEDGLKNVLKALRSTGKAKIITVFGCGGDRDRTKRPKMGKVACELSDVSIVTTDNPRSESPEFIIHEIIAGFSKENYEVVVDRTQAIHRALSMAGQGDVVLIAGKGHETYQIFKDRTIDYDERKVIRDYFKAE